MRNKQAEEIIGLLREQLIKKQTTQGLWRGTLSSSAISTSLSIFALYILDKDKYTNHVQKGAEWLKRTMKKDGSWGDSMESPSNMTATLLSYASLSAVDSVPEKSRIYLTEKFGGAADEYIIQGVMQYYGSDLTFSAPILAMCALANVIKSWDKIPQLPFELAVMPQRFFRFLQLPVVSYAIPALIAVGLLRYKKGKKNIFSPLRELFINKSLKVLEKMQPLHGGFLEASPLTAFVAMCMCGSGYSEHTATQKAAGFLANTIREDGSWPIDTDLSCWVTTLSVKALGEDIPDRHALAEAIKSNAFKFRHPFTGVREGGWGWSDLPGAVPDADDTAGSLTALHILLDGAYCEEIGEGLEWLLDLQNNDGGMPTFCKGWGKLPFDRSSPDITAHSILAFDLWLNSIPAELKGRCQTGIIRMLRWMRKKQAADGSWTPLWFGDQHAGDEHAPVYGTALAVEYLSALNNNIAGDLTIKGIKYILSVQNNDGGWGGAENTPSRVTFTSRSLSALASYSDIDSLPLERGFDFLYKKYKSGYLLNAEPIGLYFSRLWYSEEMYNLTFTLNALKKLQFHLK